MSTSKRTSSRSALSLLCAAALAILISGCDLNPPPTFVPLGGGCETCPPHTRCVEEEGGVRCIPPAWAEDAPDIEDKD